METALTLASAALPHVIDAFTSTTPTPTPSSTEVPPSRIPRPVQTPRVNDTPTAVGGMDVHDVLINPAIPVRPTFYDTPHKLGPCMTLPFQFKLHDWTGDQKLIDIDLAANAELKTLTAPYRFAQLTTLEVVVCPRQSASKYAGTVEVRFLPSDVTPTATDMISHPGAMSVSCGGPLGFVSNSALACPLDRFSPVIKSPFLPTDRIRVAVNHWLNTEATKAGNTAHIITTILRGTLLLAYPAFN
nr:coat protein [Guachaca virus]